MNKDSSTERAKSAENPKKIDVLMAKTPEITDIVEDKASIQRMIEITTTVVIVNTRITTPILFKLDLIKVVQM